MTIEERVERETEAYIQRLANMLQEPDGYKVSLLGIVAIVRFAKSKHGHLGGALARIESVIVESVGGKI